MISSCETTTKTLEISLVYYTSMRTEVSKLLFCACRGHCIQKTTPQSTTHKCPGCSIPIHPECGFPDEEDANIRWCHQCKIGQTPSPKERLTRRKIREKNLSLPKNLFDEDETITSTLDDSTITLDERLEMSKNDEKSTEERDGYVAMPQCI
jgi:hypothetical protein